MGDYISRSYLRKMAMLERAYTMETIQDAEKLMKIIDDAPAAKVRPVVEGKWRLNKDGSGTCLNCHRTTMAVWDFDTWMNFCPDCGAEMREAE